MICSFPRQSDSWVFDGLYRAGRDRARGRAAGQPRRADARRRRRHRRVLLPDRRRHAAGRGQGDRARSTAGSYVLEYPIQGDVALIRRHRGRPDGQPRLPQDRPQLRPGDGDRGDDDRSRRCAEVVEIGELDPEAVVTPGIYVDRVVPSAARPAHDVRATGEPTVEHLAADRSTATSWPPSSPATSRAGSFVNLGIGQPTTVADHLAAGLRRRPAHRERHARHGPAAASATRSTPT